jgi:hypothetical protein
MPRKAPVCALMEIAVNRETIIQKLIEHQVDYITRHGCGLWLHDVLERGFTGFANMSNAQLLVEMRRRGITDDFDDKPLPPDDDEDLSAQDEYVRRLIGECVTGDAD